MEFWWAPSCKLGLFNPSFSIINEFKKPAAVRLHKDSETLLKNSYKYVCDETQAPLYEN